MSMLNATYTISEDTIRKLIQIDKITDSCCTIHGCDSVKYQSCQYNMLRHFTNPLSHNFKLYFIVHLIPFLIYKVKRAKQNPLKELKGFIKGIVKSLLFSCGYSALVIKLTCIFCNLLGIGGRCFSFAAFFGGITLAFQNYSRQSEIAYYTISKGVETSYNLFLRRNPGFKIPFGQCFVMALACGILCFCYFDEREAFKSRYLKVFDKLLMEY